MQLLYVFLGTNLMKTNIVMEGQELVVESMCGEFIACWGEKRIH
jgi:hypothetical protein